MKFFVSFVLNLKIVYIKYSLLQLALTFLAMVAVSMAQWILPGQSVYTGVGEIALDGHSKIQYHGYSNPSLNPYIMNGIPSGLNYGYPIWRRR